MNGYIYILIACTRESYKLFYVYPTVSLYIRLICIVHLPSIFILIFTLFHVRSRFVFKRRRCVWCASFIFLCFHIHIATELQVATAEKSVFLLCIANIISFFSLRFSVFACFIHRMSM